MTDKPDRLTGQVARILSERELVVNRGTNDGVTLGMKLAVLNPNGADITDPVTGESLGSIDLAKVVVKVTQVHERVCVAATFRKWTTSGGPLYNLSLMNTLAQPPSTRRETLRLDDAEAAVELDEEDSYVRVGDKVIEVVGDEFATVQ
jgi:hypothetical protein